MPFYTPTPNINFNYMPDLQKNPGQVYLDAMQKWDDQAYKQQLRENQLAQQQNSLALQQNKLDEKALDEELGKAYEQNLQSGMPVKNALQETAKLAYMKGGKSFGDKQIDEMRKHANNALNLAYSIKAGPGRTKALTDASDLLFASTDGQLNLTAQDLEKPDVIKTLIRNGHFVQYNNKRIIKNEDMEPDITKLKKAQLTSSINANNAMANERDLRIKEEKNAFQKGTALNNLYQLVGKSIKDNHLNNAQGRELLKNTLEQNGFFKEAQNLKDESSLKALMNKQRFVLNQLSIKEKKNKVKNKQIERLYSNLKGTQSQVEKLSQALALVKSLSRNQLKDDSQSAAFLSALSGNLSRNPRIQERLLTKILRDRQMQMKRTLNALKRKGEDVSYLKEGTIKSTDEDPLDKSIIKDFNKKKIDTQKQKWLNYGKKSGIL